MYCNPATRLDWRYTVGYHTTAVYIHVLQVLFRTIISVVEYHREDEQPKRKDIIRSQNIQTSSNHYFLLQVQCPSNQVQCLLDFCPAILATSRPWLPFCRPRLALSSPWPHRICPQSGCSSLTELQPVSSSCSQVFPCLLLPFFLILLLRKPSISLSALCTRHSALC